MSVNCAEFGRYSWKRVLVALLVLPYRWLVIVNVLRFFLAVPRDGLQCVIVVIPDHTHLLIVLIVHYSNKYAMHNIFSNFQYIPYAFAHLGAVSNNVNDVGQNRAKGK